MRGFSLCGIIEFPENGARMGELTWKQEEINMSLLLDAWPSFIEGPLRIVIRDVITLLLVQGKETLRSSVAMTRSSESSGKSLFCPVL